MSRRSVTRPEVRVGGWWLSTIAPNWGELKTSTRPKGDWECSFAVTAKATAGHWRHPALVYGALVEVKLGPVGKFVGTLEEPDWDSGQMVAIGACRDAETALALNAAGAATTTPNVAIDQAIARGVVPWSRAGDFGSTPVGQVDDTGGLVSLQSVLDAWAQENNSGWRLDRQRRVIIAPTDETTVDWLVRPGSGVLGSAAEERVDRVFVRYASSTGAGKLATASYPADTPAGGVEKPVDITDRGRMTAAKATDIAEGIWSDLQGRSGFTNGLTLKRGQVTTPGGVVADLSMIKSGDTARLLGVPDPRGLGMNLDVVIGDTEYDWTEDEVQVNPVGRAARDEASALEQIGNLAVDAMNKATGVVTTRIVGVESVTFASATSTTLTVNFPVALASAPRVVFVNISDGSGASARWFAKTDTYTTTSFRLILSRDSGQAAVAWSGVPVAWEAVL